MDGVVLCPLLYTMKLKISLPCCQVWSQICSVWNFCAYLEPETEEMRIQVRYIYSFSGPAHFSEFAVAAVHKWLLHEFQ